MMKPSLVNGDHLRVCGADNRNRNADFDVMGSPPRVRSRPRLLPLGVRARGITSACAEQTRCTPRQAQSSWDHLRVCGADGMILAILYGMTGSPPRVRSRPG